MFLSCGVYEPLIVYNRSMLPVFTETGMTVNYVESRDGHNWESWRDRLRDGLSLDSSRARSCSSTSSSQPAQRREFLG